ncbi:hypothetical protein K438DRAFT_2138426 [Mycena galopus ATCC 62051]|nr:hypothetical protein K438DRAFT_2138426 [Mycena galopus ATCC 62051]
MSAIIPSDARLPSLSSRKFKRLSILLREVSVYYYHTVAVSIRASTRPTYHARARAQKLGLAINTRASVNPNCPRREVLIRPLPALERPLSASPTAGGPVLSLRKPLMRHQQQSGKMTLQLTVPSSQADATTSAWSHTPAPAAPIVLRGQNDPWLGSTSGLGLTPHDSALTLAPLLPSLLAYGDDSIFHHPTVHRPDEPLMLPELFFDFASSSSGILFQSPVGSSGPETPIDDFDVIIAKLTFSAEKCKRMSLDFDETTGTVEKSWARGQLEPPSKSDNNASICGAETRNEVRVSVCRRDYHAINGTS